MNAIQIYYLEQVRKRKYNENRNGTKVFHITDEDIKLFPELFCVDQLWVYPSGNIQAIDKRTVVGFQRNLFNNN